jgi:Lamin Tail Domain
MRRSLAALVAAGIAALSLVTGAAAASAAPQSVATAQKSFTFVIDQFATRGPNGPADQYVQIKNLSQIPQDLSNFKIEVAPSLSQIFDVASIPQGTILQPGAVYVIANPQGYSGPVVDQYFTASVNPLTDRIGIALVSPANVTVDSVATVATSPFVMKAPATPLTTNQPLALVRLTNTDNNAVDFHLAPRTPGLPSPVSLF